MTTQPASASILREFCPLYYLLNAIPAKVQRGFRSVLVYLTALDSSSDFLAVGSSIGMLYLYCRRVAHMNKYSMEGKCDAITAVKLLSCFDDLVAAGTASGRVVVFQLVSPLPGRNKQLRRFDVVSLHKGSVTSLTWSANGMKLFSGDDKGRIVFSALDLDQGVCKPVLLLEEPSGVVQMEYRHQVLLVSTQQRSVLYCTQKQEVLQLGTKPRKRTGRFGACFLPALCKQSDLQVYAARPGLRLWRSNVRGEVEETRLLKSFFDKQIPQFELFPRPGPVGAYRPADRQLGLLSCFFREGWILSWNEYSIYVFDCLNEVIIGCLESSGDIVSVSSCESEIFVLKGDREIIRLSSNPEGISSNSVLSGHLPSPLTTPTILQPIGSVEIVQPIRTMAIITEDGGKEEAGGSERLSEEGPDEEEEEEGVEEVEEAVEQDSPLKVMESSQPSTLFSSSRFRSSSVTMWDSLSSATPVSTPLELSSRRYSAPIDQERMQQELVVKPIRVKKKKKRHQDLSLDRCSGNRLVESSCSDSVFIQDGNCSDGESGTPSSDHAFLLGLDAERHDTLQQNQDQGTQHTGSDNALEVGEEVESSLNQSGSVPSAGSLLLPGLNPEKAQNDGSEADGIPPTPDVDQLLESTFSYMKAEDDGGPEPASRDETEDHPLLSPQLADQLFPSEESSQDRKPSMSSDEEGDIYCHSAPAAAAGGGGNDHSAPSAETERTAERDAEQDKNRPYMLAESWMGYSGPGCGILSLQVTDRHVWCLDFKGGLFCSTLPETGLGWQRFEDNVHQVALSPSGNLLWKVEQKTMTAFACAKVSVKGKRHWYKAAEQAAFVALSDDSAWIIRTNGDLYLQTGLSVERPCARSVKVESPCVFSQVCVRGGVVWALSEHKALFYREGLSSYCSEGDGWKYDTVSEAQGLELICIALGGGGTAWALDASGSLWFRTGVCPSRPQGDDDHWWQISISDYVVFDQGSFFQTLLQATQSVATVTRGPVERVVAFLSQYSQCQPSLVSANATGVWVASGRNQLHLARGNLVGTFWQNVVPRGTVTATRWTFITSSSVPHKEGTFLWLAQSRKDLFCVWDRDGELRPSSVQLPPEVELTHLSACRDALWGLDIHGQVSIRTLSPSCPIGLHWTLLDLSQLGSVRLVSVSCGSQNVWSVDSRGLVYFRVGTQPLNASMMMPAWIYIEPPSQPIGIQLVSIQTSPNDRLLWALDNRGSVFVRTGLSDEMPVGTDWELVPGLAVSQMVVSCQTVWVRCVNGELARRYGISDRNPAGDYWKKIPGNTNWFTVTPEEELWAVTPIGGLCRRLTKLLPHMPSAPPPAGAMPGGEDVEDEWELI
ncbi:tectonin beta-propeller repeat-containing protein 2 isoform X1 [Gambusia affinis]|uniref:tectonin beta-propeller repeat-containing protein 2 isoform X1 n=1 Tax=Gambusia affinis TaxID=33528 RepID=UPI001CDD5DE0|nr:tectonin beta-propeller repeat-containing protein 2 isoform X1 [Gambusia affinis]XP_043998672.1 tectonin beta-propeller repeat-containing protein 2 isoform X1 [Gambusia affinis]XP_043998673.1 tectonin beta-propeller repeat-containing protein 2 isoform X1 [Gambusia affinis]XP_043998674.1 tectonin beta-propeller repeat-containing protein 2 isoform X1 [Gambusia affinis]